MNRYLAILIFLTGGPVTAGASAYTIPMELESQKVYVEKFSPVYIYQLSKSEISAIEGPDSSKKNMSDFVQFLDFYNRVLYRKLNDHIQSLIDERDYSERLVPAYLRDFNESPDTSIRYIITNNYSVVTIFLAIQAEGKSFDHNKKFEYFIMDKKTGEKYRGDENLEIILNKIEYYYRLEEKGKLGSLTASDLEERLDKRFSKIKKQNNSNSYVLLVAFYSGLALLISYLIG